MQRSLVAADILQQIMDCMGAALCGQYEFARTRGLPPAECNSITASWIQREIELFEDCSDGKPPCGAFVAYPTLRIVLTRICMGPDASGSFNWQLEDAEAACFDDHLEIVEQCITCSDWSQLRADHKVTLACRRTEHDVESEGGGFSAYIEIDMRADECCDG